MKKIIAFLLALTMLLSLAACGGGSAEEKDPNWGKYIGVSAAVSGFSMPMSEIYPGETWIELKSGGKGDIMLDGDSYPMTWALEGETFTLTLEGVDSVGKLTDGVIVVDLMNMGCVMTFEKEGSSADKAAAQASYNDAGYYELIRIDSEAEGSSVSEKDVAIAKSLGVTMYLELLPDGTGVMLVEEELAVTWVDGTVNFLDDNMSINYTLENGDLTLNMIESAMVFRKGEKPVPVVSEMEQAGFTDDDGVLAGTYSLYAMDDAGEYISNETLVLMEMDGLLEVTFQDDGTGVMRVDTEEVTFTYDEAQIVDAEGSVYGYALKDGMLELYFGDDQTFYCQKQ